MEAIEIDLNDYTLAGGGFPLSLDRADFAGLKKYVTGKEV